MADTKPTEAQKAKRIVKNPETFRERAVKASEADDKPKRLARLKQAGGKVTRPITKPIAKASVKLFALKPFKLFRRPLRVIGKILFPVYFRNSWRELKQVTWPTLKQSRQLTSAVLIFAFIFGAVIAIVDYGLDKVFRNVLLK